MPLTTFGGKAGSIATQPATTKTVIKQGEGGTRPVGVAAGVELREPYGWRAAPGAVLLVAADTSTAIFPGTRRK